MDQTREILKMALDACALRHNALANNVANVNTPGYLRKEVNFKEALAKAVKSGKDLSLPGNRFTPEIVTDRTAEVKSNGNSVAVQKEIAGMMENNLDYAAYAQLFSDKSKSLRKAITGRP